MKAILKSMGLTDNEIKVYLALLKLKKGTKTPIVNESKVLPSKVYEVLERLIRRGLVTYFVENKVKNFVPVHPSNIENVFDDKIAKLNKQKEEFTSLLTKEFFDKSIYSTDVQLFKGWKGLKNAFSILIDDLNEKDSYYVLGMNGGENFKQALRFFPNISRNFDSKKIRRKVILREDNRQECEIFFEKYGDKYWQYKYYPTFGPMEIGITNNFVMISLLDEEPQVILIESKKIRDSYLDYFNMIWKICK